MNSQFIWPEQLDSPAVWRQALRQYDDWSAEHFAEYDIEVLIEDRARCIDQLLAKLWDILDFNHSEIALLAVGGYGRGALHPFSDIDLLFLIQDTLSADHEEKISRFITLLWDLKLHVGHAVRTVEQCIEEAAKEITVATSLIESRLLQGNQTLMAQLEHRVFHSFPWSSRDFYQAKKDEQTERHRHFHGTAYNLEPNIKASPGGLRDLQTISWIAKQHFNTRSDASLVDYHFITAEEFIELKDCSKLLWRFRCALHLVAKKGEDRLLFDYQPEVARLLGYGEDGKHAVERMMKDYFKTVLRVGELNRMLLQFFEQAILTPEKQVTPIPLDDDFALAGEQIMAIHDQAFTTPEQVMRFFCHVAEHETVTDVHSHTIRSLRNARLQMKVAFCHDLGARNHFLSLIQHPRGFGYAFELMHRYGVMARYLPAWEQIVGQMQFDLFHAYTVDEHTYRLVRNLFRFTQPEAWERFPLCAELVEQMEHPEWLFLAGIFHDIAKGRGGDHSELGAEEARAFGALHQLPAEGTELIAWLVEQHLLMSMTAQKRDIYDPEVIARFAEACKTMQRLNYLYCLTVADIRATNSNLWNNWKATLLEELYRATRAVLEQSDDQTVDVRERVQTNRQNAMALLLSAGFPVEDITSLWSRFTADYFFRHTPEQIAWHSTHIMHAQEIQLPLILMGDENNNGTTELFIYHKEENNLFAKVAAVLDSEQLSIHDAQILNTRDGYVMDTFIVLERNGAPVADPRRIEEVHQHLQDVLRNRKAISRNYRPLSRRMRNFQVPTKVKFILNKNQRRTTFELIALDRPGLIARLAQVLQQLDINLVAAKITTVGEQAEDLFIVASNQQEALTEAERELLKNAIIAALDEE